MVRYMRRQLRKNRTLLADPEVTVRGAGCLMRCAQGPILVVQPAGAWFRYDNTADLQLLLSEYLIGERAVPRLQVSNDLAGPGMANGAPRQLRRSGQRACDDPQ